MERDQSGTTKDRSVGNDKGDGRAPMMERVFGRGEDLLTWSVPMFRYRRTSYRLHVLFLLMVAGELMLAVPRVGLGAGQVAIALACLLAVVCVREVGRSFLAGARDAGMIVLWPLGLLTDGRSPRRRPWVTALGGTYVSLGLGCVLGAAVWGVRGGADLLLFNPLQPGPIASSLTSGWLGVLWWAYYMNSLVLCINVIPMLPLDGGRVLELALRGRFGRLGSWAFAARVGFLVGMTVFVVAMAAEQARVMGLAVLCAAVCFASFRRAEFLWDTGPAELSPEASGVYPAVEAFDVGDQRVEDRHAALRPLLSPTKGEDESEVDGVLQKISQTGMGSLDDHEREVLDRATRRRRER